MFDPSEWEQMDRTRQVEAIHVYTDCLGAAQWSIPDEVIDDKNCNVGKDLLGKSLCFAPVEKFLKNASNG
jgi:hypothetical protein